MSLARLLNVKPCLQSFSQNSKFGALPPRPSSSIVAPWAPMSSNGLRPTTQPPSRPLCLDLWKDIWKDLGAPKNGRSGHRQAGVDVSGQHLGQQVGVQCKLKNGLLRTKLTVRELENEVAAARHFQPPLAGLVLATTSPRDANGCQPIVGELWRV